MRIFGINNDDVLPGCSAHHWAEDNTHQDYRVRFDESYGSSASIYQRITEACEHDGCEAEQESWKRINHVPEGVDSGCNRRFRNKLDDVLEYP